MRTIFIKLCILFTVNLCAQNHVYVKAKNGLIVREKPSKNAVKIGKLKHGSRIRVLAETNIKLSIVDEGKTINGQWVKINKSGDIGYVFNGYLSHERVEKILTIAFDDFTFEMEIDYLNETDFASKVKKDTVNVITDLGGSPQAKEIKIKSSKFKNIQIFQRHENSVTVMNEGPHCDLTQWKHYYSDWEQLPMTSEKLFLSKNYTNKERSQFLNISIQELKKAVLSHCGEKWFELIKDTKSLNNDHYGVGINKVFFRILLTDSSGQTTEKIIVFEISMGC